MFDGRPTMASNCPQAPGGTSTGTTGWHAELALKFERRGSCTVLAHMHHRGPLRVQKILYPETPARAEVLLLHPPSGIAGGDQLHFDIDIEAQSQLRVTTPGAAKWYRSGGAQASQTLRLQVADGAVLEWLPQEAIVYDDARIQVRTQLACTRKARICGWDLWMLGRKASGEDFRSGYLHQVTELRRDDRLLWMERSRLDATDALRASPLGWNGARALGSLWALGLPADDSLLQACREIEEPGVALGITRFEHGLWLARALSESVERARQALTRIWQLLRPALCGGGADLPRIWAT